MRRQKLLRTVAAGALLAIVAGCSGSSGDRSATGPATSPGATLPSGAPITTAPAGAPVSGVPVAGAQAPESVSAALAALPANLRARIPQFPPPPAPAKLTLPPGDKAPNFTHVPTTEKIAFITIDDGWQKDPLALELFRAANVPITLFLEVDAVKPDPGYFTELQAAGATIQAHTLTHPMMTRLSYEAQKRQICGSADRLKQYYGKRPTLFRPPFGSFNATTLRAVHDCGLKASFTWKETTDKGKVRYQTPTKLVAPGDIILMHFRPAFVDDFLAVLKAIHKAGLTPARLEDYVP